MRLFCDVYVSSYYVRLAFYTVSLVVLLVSLHRSFQIKLQAIQSQSDSLTICYEIHGIILHELNGILFN